MTVLVAYASRHVSTNGIAERIAACLRTAGLSAEARSVTEVRDLDRYDAFVVGSAAYMTHWLKEATRFVMRHRVLLAERPVWLFSSGPLGTDLVDEEGQDILEATRPTEFDELTELVTPLGENVFFGAWDPERRRSASEKDSYGSCRRPRTRHQQESSVTGQPSTPGPPRSPPSSSQRKAAEV